VTERSASNTALGVAGLRAAHQIIDGEPKILDDPVALKLFDAEAVGRMKASAEKLHARGASALRAHVVLRSRYAEDRLREAVMRGVRQYVLLGAGYDTFAYRQPEWAKDLRVYEVDQPASQHAKRERLSVAGVSTPNNLEFVPVDFEKETVRDGLTRSTFDTTAPAFFSWLGVTMYLTLDAVTTVLGFVASLPPSTEIVFTFAQPVRWFENPSLIALAAAAAGEPWITRLAPEEVVAMVERAGFSAIEFLTRDEAMIRYFNGRRDGLEPPRRVSIASAIV